MPLRQPNFMRSVEGDDRTFGQNAVSVADGFECTTHHAPPSSRLGRRSEDQAARQVEGDESLARHNLRRKEI